MNTPTLYQAIQAAGIETSNHESDLYFPATAESRAILANYPLQKRNATIFHNQCPPNVGALWFDVPFNYDPFWERVAGLQSHPQRRIRRGSWNS